MTAFAAATDGIAIAYDVEGEGEPLILIHGFGASRVITWKNTSWYQTITRAGRKLIAVDCRGHGESGKPHAVAAYDHAIMAEDILRVVDALKIVQADVMGYSMGGYLAIRLLHDWPQRMRRAVLAGIGERYFRPSPERAEIIAQGLEAKDPATITDPVAREFRTFCERAGNDLVALAACMRCRQRFFSAEELGAIHHPVLVVSGQEDRTAGAPEPLAQAFPNGRTIVVPRRNHHSTVGDRFYKDAVVDFLSR